MYKINDPGMRVTAALKSNTVAQDHRWGAELRTIVRDDQFVCRSLSFVGWGRLFMGGHMLLAIQFPFADSRKFVENSRRLLIPSWPSPTPDSEFVRYFGPVRVRRGGGINGWVGENEVCEADRALRFSDTLSFFDQDTGRRLPLHCAYRRFYFDGWAVAKFEVGLATRKSTRFDLTKKQASGLFNHFLNLPVKVQCPEGENGQVQLGRAGKPLARLYNNASSNLPVKVEPPAWWIRPGLALLFVQVQDDKDAFEVPYWLKTLMPPSVPEVVLGHCYVPSPWGGNFRTWLLWHEGKENEKVRTLRLYLMRLHAEHEALRLVLNNVINEKIQFVPRSKSSDYLQFYLNQATRRIGALEKKSSQKYDDEIAEIARESINQISPGQRDKLLETLEALDVRGNVVKDVMKYAEQWGSVTINLGDVIMTGDSYSNISHSVITARNSIANNVTILEQKGQDDIANAIAELQKLIEEAPEEALPPEKKDESTDLLKGISDEAAKPEPNKNIMKVLGGSLMALLTNAEPIAKAAKAAFDVIQKIWI
jgi:hypothetical protein